MRYPIYLFLFLFCFKSFSQNVHIEIDGKRQELEGKTYSIYQFASASYSYSRATIVFIANEEVFKKAHYEIPELYKAKQEYTDIWFIGIKDLSPESLTETDKKIINLLYDKIIKYRDYSDLPKYEKEQLKGLTFFILKEDDLCKHLSCRPKQNKKTIKKK